MGEAPPVPPPAVPPVPAVPPPADPARPAYPATWEADVVASDGGVVHLRPILPSDADALVAFHDRLSPRTRYLRFFGSHPHLSPKEVERFTVVDHHARVAFVALLGDEIVAVGRYEGTPAAGPASTHPPRTPSAAAPRRTTPGGPGVDGPAEIAFVVRDDHQGRGLGSILLEHLTAAARERGVRRFEAEVLAENTRMVRVFRDAGYQVSRAFADGAVHLEFDVDPTERSVEVRDAREQRSEARSVHNVLHPGSVAVIGASADPATVGHAVLSNLLGADFAGPVYPVHPEARSVHGVRAYRSVAEVPDEVDLAVVAAAPPGGMRAVVDSCLDKGVRALVVLSAAPADPGSGAAGSEGDGDGSEGDGSEGDGAEEDGADGDEAGGSAAWIAALARAHGMRVVGPNALGVANADPDVRLNATLAPALPGHGRIGFFSQSGALGVALLSAAAEHGVGFSTFVSAGNRADLSNNDMLQYWQTDPGTDVVLLYLESFGNPRKFARLARRLARTKPVLVVASGGWSPVTRAGLPSPGPARLDGDVSALFAQAGMIRVQNLTQMFDAARLLAHQPLPRGGRVAVVGNSTALNLLVVEACRGEGLDVTAAPVDAGTAVGPADLAGAAAAQARRDDVDAVVVVFVAPVATSADAHARALRTAAAELDTPLVAAFLGAPRTPDPGPHAGPRPVPSYPTPERAVAALGCVARYGRWRAAPVGEYVRPPGIDVQGARAVVDAAACAAGGAGAADGVGEHLLPDADQVALLACYGISVLPFRRVRSAAATVDAARELGFPVAVKAVDERWRHRADGAGVRLAVVTHQGARQAFADLARLSGHDEVYVQRMAPPGTACVFELVDDPSFGSLVSFGLSGMVSELIGDRARRMLPLSTQDAAALVRAPRAAPLLAGYRGDPPARLDALEDLALRLSRLAADLPEVRSLVLDPVIAGPDGVAVAGARVVLGPAPAREEASPRRMG